MDQIWIKEYCARYWQVKYKVKSYPTKKWVFGPVKKGCELTSEKKKFKALFGSRNCDWIYHDKKMI